MSGLDCETIVPRYETLPAMRIMQAMRNRAQPNTQVSLNFRNWNRVETLSVVESVKINEGYRRVFTADAVGLGTLAAGVTVGSEIDPAGQCTPGPVLAGAHNSIVEKRTSGRGVSAASASRAIQVIVTWD